MTRDVRGLRCIIGDDATSAVAVAAQQKKSPSKSPSNSDETSWYTIGGMVLAIVAGVVFVPRIMRDE